MGMFRSGSTRRNVKGLVASAFVVMLVMAAFGTSFAIAQEPERAFLLWRTMSNGAAQISSPENVLQGMVGQSAVGFTTSDEFEVTYGFHTGVIAGTQAFSEQVRTLALTPEPTPVPTSTATPLPTATATAVPPTATPVNTATATPLPATATATAVPPTATATSLPPTATVTRTPRPTASPTPVIIVVTSVPEPSPTRTPRPTASPTPFILVATSVPEPSPTATPEPPSGGACGVPIGNGPVPLDVGLLLLLALPALIWKVGLRP